MYITYQYFYSQVLCSHEFNELDLEQHSLSYCRPIKVMQQSLMLFALSLTHTTIDKYTTKALYRIFS